MAIKRKKRRFNRDVELVGYDVQPPVEEITRRRIMECRERRKLFFADSLPRDVEDELIQKDLEVIARIKQKMHGNL